MKPNYFVSVEIADDKYVGKVFESSSNQLIYSSKQYNTQEQAIADARTFIITSSPPATDPKPSSTITSTSSYTQTRSPHTGKCCGR